MNNRTVNTVNRHGDALQSVFEGDNTFDNSLDNKTPVFDNRVITGDNNLNDRTVNSLVNNTVNKTLASVNKVSTTVNNMDNRLYPTRWNVPGAIVKRTTYCNAYLCTQVGLKCVEAVQGV